MHTHKVIYKVHACSHVHAGALTSSCVLEERSSGSKDCSPMCERRSLKVTEESSMGKDSMDSVSCFLVCEVGFSICGLRNEESSFQHDTVFSSCLSISASLSSTDRLD